ncbi:MULTISPECIES: hypothetical protein [unclassified Paracoccus (in: a-proteobacteria)]|uniref:hypothetical protein n=1 Tax=unclassified Paracoccus (in: a-proteobacteria) TaxID=2688777 RepID=UPI000ABD4202|nr:MULTISPECIES: hypothetical protein [unclassified Paracoccus (in: a-proteobacteria)]MCO6363687.1 hypothetical protein [Paracoccus sp. 08]
MNKEDAGGNLPSDISPDYTKHGKEGLTQQAVKTLNINKDNKASQLNLNSQQPKIAAQPIKVKIPVNAAPKKNNPAEYDPWEILAVLIPMLIVIGVLLYLDYKGDSWIAANKIIIELRTKTAGFLGVSSALIGAFIAVLVELSPKDFQDLKLAGAIFRFWGAMFAFGALYVAILILTT